jgi:hypothetical protein
LKRDYKKRSPLSSYYDYEINAERLLDVSKGNKKLVNEVLETVDSHQKDDKWSGGFLGIQTFFIRKNNLDEITEWVHVVFDHGHGVTLLVGRVGRIDFTYKQFMDKSNIYSMASMIQNG